MDAKVDDWVVTPRRGKAVEINALWYNALRLLESWLHDHPRRIDAAELGERSRNARARPSTSGSGMRKANTYTTSWIRKTAATMRHAGRTSCCRSH